MPFMPTGSISMTPFSHGREGPANVSVLGDKKSPAVGKFTHPSGAPDGRMLTVYSPGPVNHQYEYLPQLDGGIYLFKSSAVVERPSEMLLIKNDPRYNESWPRALVPYARVHGVPEPKRLPRLRNDGSRSAHLPAGTPFGLVGSSSLYKRESYPDGVVPDGAVTATYAGGPDAWKGLDAFTSHGNGMPINWHNQGGDVGLYTNDEIHALRILVMEPTTDRRRGAHSGRRFYNHAHERLRILGEIPVRKFQRGKQPIDPDGNPDTSFLVRIPADTAFTFQTIDRRGMSLNMSQTWHQLRPGEVRTDCGGCHAHSQKPTLFSDTIAGKSDFVPWDLVASTPLLTTKKPSGAGVRWDVDDATGLRERDGAVVDVEYWRDIRPILDRSCVPCHSGKKENPAGKLVLDADDELVRHRREGKFPGTYYRLALDEKAQFGHRPIGYDSWGYPNASRYIRKFQSRRSLLVWKIFGRRLDGFSNDDHPSPATPGNREKLVRTRDDDAVEVDLKKNRSRWDLDFRGLAMPPPKAVAEGGIPALSDEDRFTIVRWIDLGCPIDLDASLRKDPKSPDRDGYGWMLDDNRPILAVETPLAGRNDRLDRILIGLADYYSGLELSSFEVVASFDVDGIAAGENLASRFLETSTGVRELRLERPIEKIENAKLSVLVRDRQGNVTRVERSFSVGLQ
jgi:hypothetical protein